MEARDIITYSVHINIGEPVLIERVGGVPTSD